MTDDQPSGSCPTCHRRDPRVQQLCDPCRSRLRSWVFDIPDLYSQLSEGEPSVREYRGTRLITDDEGVVLDEVPHYDHVSNALPAGGISAGFRLGPISGSTERRLPIDTDAVDLTGPVRSAGTAVLDEDAVGYESVASVLDFWVEDWRASRGKGERRPGARVSELSEWLLIRLDDACDHSAPIAEFFDAVRRLRGALQAQLGQVDIPDYKRGVPCPHCAALTLVFHAGSSYIECGSCPAQVSFLEYEEHVRALSAEQVLVRRVKVAQIKAVRRLLDALRAAGWRHAVRRDYDADAGTYLVHYWKRDTALIEVWWTSVDGWFTLGGVWWVADEVNPSLSLSVSGDWVEAYGLPALQKLARAAGILTAPKKEEVAA